MQALTHEQVDHIAKWIDGLKGFNNTYIGELFRKRFTSDDSDDDQDPEFYISLKWGALKGYNLDPIKHAGVLELLKEYNSIDDSDNDDDGSRIGNREKEILCRAIDLMDDYSIYLNWDGVFVTRDRAKEYIMTYGNK